MPTRDPANHPMIRSELTGEMLSTWSEEWRHETEAAYLLSLPPTHRNELLDGIPGGTGDDRGIRGVRRAAAVAELREAIDRLADIRRRNSH